MNNIYEYIAAKGATWGIPPSPFGPFGTPAQRKPGPVTATATLMGRVGGLGNGGGKLQTALAQGRGILGIK